MTLVNLGNAQFDIDDVLEALAEQGYGVEKNKSTGRYKPELGDSYYYSDDGDSLSDSWDDHSLDHDRLALGNAYRTGAECEAAIEKQKALVRIQDKYREFLDRANVVLDWGNKGQRKARVYYDHRKSSWEISILLSQRSHPTSMYCTKEGCKWVVDNMQDDLKLVWDIS